MDSEVEISHPLITDVQNTWRFSLVSPIHLYRRLWHGCLLLSLLLINLMETFIRV
jgi:hypothetical protein